MTEVVKRLTRKRKRQAQNIFKSEFEGREFDHDEYVETLDSEEVVFIVWDVKGNCLEILFFGDKLMCHEILKGGS